MLEPQSIALFVLLIVVFGALMWWQLVARRLVGRILVVCLAFISAMMLGVAAVNKYFDYYQNWSARSWAVPGRGFPGGAQGPGAVSDSGGGLGLLTGRYVDSGL